MFETLTQREPYSLRPALLEDADLMASLIRRAWAGTVLDPMSKGHRTTGGMVLTRFQQGGGGFLVETLEEAVGTVQYVPLEHPSRIWEIMGVGILREHRGKALVDRLLEVIEVTARRREVLELRLAVRSDANTEKLVSVYRRSGYEVDELLEYSHRNPLTAPPVVLRKVLS